MTVLLCVLLANDKFQENYYGSQRRVGSLCYSTKINLYQLFATDDLECGVGK